MSVNFSIELHSMTLRHVSIVPGNWQEVEVEPDRKCLFCALHNVEMGTRSIFSLMLAIGLQLQAAQALELSGPTVIVDGDTIEIGAQAFRIHGIDAPETTSKYQLPKGT